MDENYNYGYTDENNGNGKKKSSKIVVFIMLIAGSFIAINHFSDNSMLFTNTYTDETLTIQTPKSVEYYEDGEDAYYVSESTLLHVDWYYLNKDYGMTLDDMMPLVFAYWFPEGEYGVVEDVVINDREAKKLSYKCLQVGKDGIHYYYSGDFVLFELSNRFVVADIYYSLSEAEGINNDIDSSQRRLIDKIANTIKIEDNTPDFPKTKINQYKLDKFVFILSDAWENSTEDGDYSEDAYGRYAYYQYKENSINMQCSEMMTEDTNDLGSILNSLQGQPYRDDYTIIDENFLNGEPCMVVAYNSVQESSGVGYVSGVFAISEHYYADIFMYTVNDDYELTKAMQREIEKDLLD
ncbi:MAG: hypothetical protein AB1Z23_12430 [Eubacteriales bacterium]